jgi:hypothetical protein
MVRIVTIGMDLDIILESPGEKVVECQMMGVVGMFSLHDFFRRFVT